jgi:hypothetical protein
VNIEAVGRFIRHGTQNPPVELNTVVVEDEDFSRRFEEKHEKEVVQSKDLWPVEAKPK